MAPLIIFSILIVVGLAGLVMLRMKWNRESNLLAKTRADRIETERVEAIAKSRDAEKS